MLTPERRMEVKIMPRRFTVTEKWTQDNWFMGLDVIGSGEAVLFTVSKVVGEEV